MSNREHQLFDRGDYTYGNPILKGELSRVITGKFCSVSDFAVFDCGMNHGTSYISTFPFNQKLDIPTLNDKHPLTNGNIMIGHDVTISEHAFIKSGVTICTGAIIGYGAVVTRDVEPYEIVGGVPAKQIRHRFYRIEREELLDIAWWDWPIEKIKENAHLLMGSNIKEFIKLHRIK